MSVSSREFTAGQTSPEYMSRTGRSFHTLDATGFAPYLSQSLERPSQFQCKVSKAEIPIPVGLNQSQVISNGKWDRSMMNTQTMTLPSYF